MIFSKAFTISWPSSSVDRASGGSHVRFVSRAPLIRTSRAHCALNHPAFPKVKLCDTRAKICDVFIEISQFHRAQKKPLIEAAIFI